MNWIRRHPHEYFCPVCGLLQDVDIDWDAFEDINEKGELIQWGFCPCRCGAKVVFKDVYKVVETHVGVEE